MSAFHLWDWMLPCWRGRRIIEWRDVKTYTSQLEWKGESTSYLIRPIFHVVFFRTKRTVSFLCLSPLSLVLYEYDFVILFSLFMDSPRPCQLIFDVGPTVLVVSLRIEHVVSHRDACLASCFVSNKQEYVVNLDPLRVASTVVVESRLALGRSKHYHTEKLLLKLRCNER